MSQNYLVLARKYRPANFAHLKSQEFLVTTIINAIKLERVAHTFLLTGIRGGGKTTAARIIAKTLNCSSPIIEEKMILPCGECKNCLASLNDNHPDIIELDAASRTGVDDVRSIIENASYLPMLGKYKIYIIDEVHMLSTSAFNALLKTLEEPPAHVKFIFATTELRKIPITILSRCQKFELRRLNDEELVQHLQEILKIEGISADKDALQLIATHAEGSVRDSLSLLDLIIANANNAQITKEQVKNLLGLSDSIQIISLLEAIIKGDAENALIMIKQFYYMGKDLLYTLQQMMELIHNISKIKLNIKGLALEYSEDDLLRLFNLAEKMNIASLTILWQMLLKGMKEMQASRNVLMSAEMLMIRFCYLSNIPTPADLIDKINAFEPILSESVITAKADFEQPIQQKKKINNFEELVQLFYTQREMLLYEYLVNDIQLVDFAPLKIKVKQSASVPQNFTNKIAALLQEYTGEKWNILVTSEGEATPTIATQIDEAKAKKIEEASQNPLVQEVLQRFPSAQVKDVI
jgi:DNA polymerase-3 subunit gamma/tau